MYQFIGAAQDSTQANSESQIAQYSNFAQQHPTQATAYPPTHQHQGFAANKTGYRPAQQSQKSRHNNFASAQHIWPTKIEPYSQSYQALQLNASVQYRSCASRYPPNDHPQHTIQALQTSEAPLQQPPPNFQQNQSHRSSYPLPTKSAHYSSQACYNCGGHDHWAQDCPEPRRAVPV
jgi:Zinc knuckle